MSAPVSASAKQTGRATTATGPEARGASMHAHVGDEIVVRGTGVGAVARDGEVVVLHHPDGSPPYDMRRADSGRLTVYLPGPGSCVRHLTSAAPAAGDPESGGRHDPAR
ncbi:DUF1918 domain-containing protein [Streptomyces sp. NPDC058457]|uniref:DUF1918 domain-containing protein n=1 Tax=Streptomyces sp. NPDC058457 TaxID=3346507 RepID=UPI00364C4ACA